jgi:hypothetical protein
MQAYIVTPVSIERWVFAAAHDLNICRTQQIHATQSAGHFISRQFSFLLFENIARTAKFIPLNSEKIRRSNWSIRELINLRIIRKLF